MSATVINGANAVARIQTAVGARHGLSRAELVSASQTRRIIGPRDVAIYLARTMTTHPVSVIGRAFRRDHTTILKAIERTRTRIEADEALRDQVAAIAEDVAKDMPVTPSIERFIDEALDAVEKQMADAARWRKRVARRNLMELGARDPWGLFEVLANLKLPTDGSAE